jgi:hypothetical protein
MRYLAVLSSNPMDASSFLQEALSNDLLRWSGMIDRAMSCAASLLPDRDGRSKLFIERLSPYET